MQIGSVAPFIALFLTACSMTTIAPAEQVHQQTEDSDTAPQKASRTVIKKQQITEYQCANAKRLSVQSSLTPQKNRAITVTFNQRSHKLSPNIVDRGKKYSNIRWIWTIDHRGIGTLTDNRHTVLAKNCKKR